MELLRQGEIRVHLKGGNSYVSPEINKANVVRCNGESIMRIEHYKSPQAPKPVAKVDPRPKGKTKASLLGGLLKDNKIKAGELIEWINACNSLEDLAIVMKDEGRTTVKNAYIDRIKEL